MLAGAYLPSLHPLGSVFTSSHFLTGLLVLFTVELESSSYILDISLLPDIWSADICSLSVSGLFISLTASFIDRSFKFWWGSIYWSFLLWAVFWHQKTFGLSLDPKDLCLYFILSGFIIFFLHLGSVICFELICHEVCGSSQGSVFIACAQSPRVEKLSFLSQIALTPSPQTAGRQWVSLILVSIALCVGTFARITLVGYCSCTGSLL